MAAASGEPLAESECSAADDIHNNQVWRDAAVASLWGTLATCSASLLCALFVLALPGPLRDRKRHGAVGMAFLLSFAAGGMIGDVLLHLLPHAFEAAGESHGAHTVGEMTMIGVLGFYVFDLVVGIVESGSRGHNHHSHSSSGALNLVSDALHNFTDGAMVATAFLASRGLGMTTTFAVWLHEVPQEVGDFGILLRSGVSWTRAVALNVACSMSAVLGTGFALWMGASVAASWSAKVLPLTAGGLLYTAMVSVMGEVRRLEEEDRASGARARKLLHASVQVVGFGLGVASMALVAGFEGGPHGHQHVHAAHDHGHPFDRQGGDHSAHHDHSDHNH